MNELEQALADNNEVLDIYLEITRTDDIRLHINQIIAKASDQSVLKEVRDCLNKYILED